MDDATSLQAGPFDVRTKLLEVIGCRKEGVSRSELSREMRELVKGQDPFFYEEDLALLVMERNVSISFCGSEDHRIQVYTLGSSYGEILDSRIQKRCYRCKKHKGLDAFRRRNDTKDGRCGQCRMCENRQRRLNGWANKARKKRQEEKRREQVQDPPTFFYEKAIPNSDEIKLASIKVKNQSIEKYRQQSGGGRYIEVSGRSVPATKRGLSPVVEFDRAWKRIMTGKINLPQEREIEDIHDAPPILEEQVV